MPISRKDFLRNSLLATGLSITSASQIIKDLNWINKPEMIKPRALKVGDTLGLVAPASPIYQDQVFQEMIANLKDLGFKLKLGKSVKKQYGYLAGRDDERLLDLMTMFEDDEVNGIMCIRGGWGSNRILPLIDYKLIRDNPKVFCGFSDITSIHMAINKYSGLYTFHGPVGKSVWNEYTTQAFRDTVMSPKLKEIKIPDEEKENAFIINSGKTTERIFGGNLSVLTTLIGTDYLPDLEGVILFLEDVGESVYRIDRLLTHLKMAGILDKISGFIFGKCTKCNSGSNSLQMGEVLKHHIKPLQIPAFYGAMISHEDNNLTIPIGINTEMDADNMVIRFMEKAVLS
ncbi:LD-carboxypeptidase [Gracilimonas sp. Q87]|uniref:S66 peptidase family protein n=1 Tax=Gracilimonas sp. Q87 TaxID=3384766 RepID=UPI0039843429